MWRLAGGVSSFGLFRLLCLKITILIMLPINTERDAMDHVSQEYWHGWWKLIILRINFHCITLHCICWANIHQLSVCVEARTNSLNSFWPYVGTIFLYTHNWIAIKHTNNNQPWSWPYQVSYLHTQQLTTSVSLSLCTIYSRWICAIAAAKIYIVFAKHKVIEYSIIYNILFKFKN